MRAANKALKSSNKKLTTRFKAYKKKVRRQKSQNNDVDVVVERINDFDNHISGELNQLVAGVNAIVESENSVAISNEKIVNYYYAPKKYSKKRKVTPQPTYISIDTISCEGKKYIVLPIK